jgi:hypothetical protein
MAISMWAQSQAVFCERAQEEVVLSEQRVFPQGLLRQGLEYRVQARRCSHALQCNLNGLACRWAFTNPEVEPLTIP